MTRLVLVATCAAGICTEFVLLRSAAKLRTGLGTTSAEISILRDQLSADDARMKAEQDSISSHLRQYAAIRKKASPIRLRITRMLRMLTADRAKFGASDPIKLKPGYTMLGSGFNGELMQNEDYERSQRTIVRYELETTLGPFIAQLAARGVDTQRFLNLAEEWRIGPEEARGIALGQGLSGKLASQAYAETSTSVEKELGDFLGPDGLASYKAYAQGQYLADQVVQRLSYTGTQLTPGQYVQLASIIGKDNEPQGMLEGWVNPSVYAASSAILAPDQLEALQVFVVDKAK